MISGVADNDKSLREQIRQDIEIISNYNKTIVSQVH